MQNIVYIPKIPLALKDRNIKQAGAELGQAQNKLGLDLTLIFCRLGFSRFGLVELVGRFSFIGLMEMILLKHFDLVGLVWQTWFRKINLIFFVW